MCLNSLVPEVIRSPKVYDVVVIGSGAGGGAVVQVLTGKGIEVALMEAGPMLDPEKDYKEHMLPHHVDHRGAGEGGAPLLRKAAMGLLSGAQRRVGPGGRTLHGGAGQRIPLVPVPDPGRPHQPLRPASHSGSPITISCPTPWTGWAPTGPSPTTTWLPYYDKAESFIGVTGSIEGIRSAPDGIFQPCPPPKAHEHLIKQACSRMNIPCIPMRRAVITKPLNGRPACHYCGQCGRGCITASNYASRPGPDPARPEDGQAEDLRPGHGERDPE